MTKQTNRQTNKQTINYLPKLNSSCAFLQYSGHRRGGWENRSPSFILMNENLSGYPLTLTTFKSCLEYLSKRGGMAWQFLIGAAYWHALDHQQFTEVCDVFGDDLDRPSLC